MRLLIKAAPVGSNGLVMIVDRRFLYLYSFVTIFGVLNVAALIIFHFANPAIPAQIRTGEMAIAVARRAWSATYEKAPWHGVWSKEYTLKFEPYSAKLDGDSWLVRGSVPSNFRGAMPIARVRRIDGAVELLVETVE